MQKNLEIGNCLCIFVCCHCATFVKRRRNMVYLREESHVIILRDFALLELKSGEYAMIDIEDAEEVSKYEWRSHEGGYGDMLYVVRVGDRLELHRFLKLLTDNDIQKVDHVNGDTFDNRRSNIRACTQQKNVHNWRKRRYKKCQSRGVTKNECGKYTARIMDGLKPIYLGTFDDEAIAAHAYQKKAEELYGAFAGNGNNL